MDRDAFLEKGNRGGIVLIHNIFRYHKNRQWQEKIFWRCWHKECQAPLQTAVFDVDEDEPEITVLMVRKTFPHQDFMILLN